MRYYSIFLLIIFLFSCSNKEKWEGIIEKKNGIIYIQNPENGKWNNQKKMILKKLISIGGENNNTTYTLARPGNVKTDGSQNIYILDFLDNCVKVFDKNGKYIRKIGTTGSGPGELYGPKYFDLDSNGDIHIYEAMNNRTSIFYSNGNFKRSFQFKQYLVPNSIIAMGNHLFFSTINYRDNSIKMIYQYDKTGNLINSFGDGFLLGKGTFGNKFAFPYISKHPDSKILCSLEYPYEIRNYDMNGKLISVITRNDPRFPEPKKTFMSTGTFSWVSQCSITEIIVFPSGDFFVSIVNRGDDFLDRYKKAQFDPSKLYAGLDLNWSRRYDLYNNQGEFLQTFRISKEKGRIAHIDTEGNIYTVSNEDQIPQVCKYSISFEDMKK